MSKVFTKQTVRAVQKDAELEPADTQFALDYLEYYYVEDKVTALAQTDVPSLVRKFQKMFGLKVNGKLDEQTMRAMRAPRCGCPDYKMMKAASGPQAAKWGPKKLTYWVESYVSGISRADQDDLLDLAFQDWEDVCQLDITRVAQKGQANMILSTGSGRRDNFDGPGGTLAWAYLPPNNNYNGQLLMRFDLAETWITNARDRGILFRNVACHEFGHLLGLDHSRVQRALMAPYYAAGIVKPQPNDDVTRIQRLYGRRVTPPDPGPGPDPDPGPGPGPSPGSHTVEVTGIENLDQVKIDGKSVTDFSLI